MSTAIFNPNEANVPFTAMPSTQVQSSRHAIWRNVSARNCCQFQAVRKPDLQTIYLKPLMMT